MGCAFAMSISKG
jgi:hypothetical protein